MTQNKRIFLNIVATYGRSLYALVIGLFCGRWTLMALGETDFGLMGAVGGIVGFISLFNNILASAVGRFYAVAVGAATHSVGIDSGLENCRKWFSTAVLLHLAIPLVLMSIGYPIGVWTVRNFLTIPMDRVSDCVWVFRFVCISCMISMVSVPVNAMYTAKQYIAELTIYSFVTTTLNAVFLYYMLLHPGVWLAKYAFWMCVLSVAPQFVIAIRGFFVFPECRLRFRYCVSLARIKSLLAFSGWLVFGCLGAVLRGQGVQILLNKYYGPRANASMGIANMVNGHTTTLSGAMLSAFHPAIVTAYGAGELDRMRSLAFRACKFSALFILVFMLPLALELREVLRLWLGYPPRYVYGLCMIMFAMTMIDQVAQGHQIAVAAVGKIAKYQAVLGSSLLAALPLAWLFCALGWGIYSVAGALLVTMAFCSLGRVWFARGLAGMSARYWLLRIVFPITMASVLCALVGFLPRLFLEPSFNRVCLTTAVCELVFLSMIWFVLFDDEERAFCRQKIFTRLPILKECFTR